MEASRQDRLKEWEEQRRAAGFQSLAWGAAEAAAVAARQPASRRFVGGAFCAGYGAAALSGRGDGLCSPPPELQPPASLPRRQACWGLRGNLSDQVHLGPWSFERTPGLQSWGYSVYAPRFCKRRPRDCEEPAGQSEGGFSSRSVCPLLPHVGF